MEFYPFCQHCKDRFETAGPKSYERIFLAAFFLKDRVLNHWQQYKTRVKRNQATLLS